MIKPLLILCLIIVFFLGFFLGRKLGLKQGLKAGLEQAPLEIKRRSLEIGKCIICGIPKNFQDIAGKL